MTSQKFACILVGILILHGSGASAEATLLFGTPEHLGTPVNSTRHEGQPSISADGLALFFNSGRPGGVGGDDLYLSTRPTPSDPFGSLTSLTELNTPSNDRGANISRDGLTLFFDSDRPGGVGDFDLWMATRSSFWEPFTAPVNLEALNSPERDVAPSISADGLALFFASRRETDDGNSNIWMATRATASDPFGAPVKLGPGVNSEYSDTAPAISTDGLTLFFASDRPGTLGNLDLWAATRALPTDPFGEPVHLPISSPETDSGPDIAYDGSVLYFISLRVGGLGGGDVWQVRVIPEPSSLILGLLGSCLMVSCRYGRFFTVR